MILPHSEYRLNDDDTDISGHSLKLLPQPTTLLKRQSEKILIAAP